MPRTLVSRASLLALLLAALHGGAQAVDVPIHTLQGSGAKSAYAGQAVTTTGVVTRLNSNGFFIQDLTGDGLDETSDGLFVFTSSHRPAVGALVRVAGSVLEYNVGAAGNAATAAQPLTELGSVSAVTVLGTGYTIAPTRVTLPLPAGQTLERYEGMLVTLVGAQGAPLTVQQNYFQARYGQLTLGVGRHETPTNRHRPGSAAALALDDLQARSRVLLDDGSSAQNPNPTPYQGADGLPRAGDTVAALTGVIDYGLATASNAGLAAYRLHPTATPVFTAANPRPASPPAVGGNVRVAAANVLNYFTTFTDGGTADGRSGQGCTLGDSTAAGNCRGASNLAEFQRQQAKTVRMLAGLDADVVGLMEIQNNGATAVRNLVDALNAHLGGTVYAAVPDPAAGTGTDAIKVALIYKPAQLSRVGAALSDTDAVNSRPTLAQTFAAANGERVSVLVNHFKSKGSCPAADDAEAAGNTDAGDGQGCWNAKRVAQARRLRSFVAQVQAAAGSADVLLLGDLNAYAQEDPVHELSSNGFVDLLARQAGTAYSYVFDGQSGRLDHALASAGLAARLVGAGHWHINADESLAQDYNREFKQPVCAGCAPDPYDGLTPARASDHDPLLLGLELWKTLRGSAGRDTLLGTPGDDRLVGGAGADTLSGGGGRNVFVYESLRDAGDTITDFVPGQDRIDLRTLLAAIGASPAGALASGVLRLQASGANTLLLVDTDGLAGAGAPRTLATLLNVGPAQLSPARDLLLQ